MIVYTSMFLYIFFVGYIGKALINKFEIKTKYDNGTTVFLLLLVMSMPIFFIGMRTNYVDTKGYMAGFEAMSRSWGVVSSGFEDSKAIGWNIYQWVIKRFITQDANTFLMITAIIQGIALLKLYYKYSVDSVYSVLLFFLSCSFTNLMNGIRQFMAVTLILYFADYIFEKKYVKFLLVVSVACFLHNSAIIWAPIVFIVHGKPFNKKTVGFSLLIVLAVTFLTEFTGFLEESLVDTAYEGYTAQFAEDDGSSIMHTLIAAVPVVIAFANRKKIHEINDEKANVLVNISLVAVMINVLANFTSGILMGRMPIYFTVFNYALLPWLFKYTFNEKNGKIMRILCVLGYSAYAIYYMFNSWGSMGMPYISDVLGIDTWH